MRQFDVYENPSTGSRAFAPFVMVLQSHHLEPLSTVIVAPIVRDAYKPADPVDIPVEIADQALVLAISELGAVPRASMRKPIDHLGEFEDQIRSALGRLFTGF